MALTADQLALARSWIGIWETDEEFEARFDRLADLDESILESIRAHRAYLVDRASSTQVEDISVSYIENIRALDRIVTEFQAVGGTAETATETNVTKLSRTIYR